MTGADVGAAADVLGIKGPSACQAIGVVLPLLRELTKGRAWWLRYGMAALVRALEQYHRDRCGG